MFLRKTPSGELRTAVEIRLKSSAGMSVGAPSAGTVAVRRCRELLCREGLG